MSLTDQVTEESLDRALLLAETLYPYVHDIRVYDVGTAAIIFDWYDPTEAEIADTRQKFLAVLGQVFTPAQVAHIRRTCTAGKTKAGMLAIKLAW